MNNTHTQAEITPATSADYKTHRAIRQWLIWRHGADADCWHYFTGTRRAAEDHVETFNSTTPGAPWRLQSTGAKLENESMLAAWVLATSERVENMRTGSAWWRGVQEYAREIMHDRREEILAYPCRQNIIDTADDLEHWCMNGADSWRDYSEGACTLYTLPDIAERLLPPSQRQRISCTKAMELQLQALRQAARFICREWSHFCREYTAQHANA